MKISDILAEQTNDPPIRIIPDDSQEIAPTSAAEFQRKTGEILVRQRYQNNQPLLYHEIGHAVFDDIQNITAAYMFQQDQPAWQEFLTTSTARSYQTRLGMPDEETRNNPTAYDWVEALADLYMEYRLNRFANLPHLTRFITTLLNSQPQ